MKTKKINNLIKILFISFLLFLIIYFSNIIGYYDYKNYNRARLTEESILQFEKDVSEGKDVSINDYSIYEYEDFSNKVTIIGSTIGNGIENVMNSGIKRTVNLMTKLFYN